MSKNLGRLCALLVEDVYGPFFSKIFSTLTAYGRLSATHIAQRCQLPLRHVRSGLAVLVHLRLVYHHTNLDSLTIYEANLQASYNLLRIGRVVQNVERKYGSQAGEIIRKVGVLGHCTIAKLDLELQSRSTNGRTVHNKKEIPRGVNGTRNSAEKSGGLGNPENMSVRKVLRRLARDQYVLEVRRASFQNWSDVRNDSEIYVRTSGLLSNSKGKKAQLELESQVESEMKARTYCQILSEVESQKPASLKRQSGYDAEYPGAKRLKTSNTTTGGGQCPISAGDVEESYGLDDDLVICVNFEKAIAALRNERLAADVSRKNGQSVGQVFAAALLQIPSPSRQPWTLARDKDNPESQYQEIDLDKLLLAVNSADGPLAVAPHMSPNSQDKSLLSHSNGHLNGHGSHQDGAPLTAAFVREQLQIIAEGISPLIEHEASTGRWRINLPKLSSHLRDAEVAQIVGNRLGGTAMRIIRMLDDKGKVDEKCLQELGLLSAKDLRQTLGKLQSQGFVELQEVPREPQRQPNRTIYLWFYDPYRVQSVLLEDTWKSMVRILQIVNLERSKIRSTLEKVERSDVRGREEKLLAPGELSILNQWRRKERWLLAELDRLDGTVARLWDW